jgi:GPH family glycoside/pentoside/hexuronide:cation symporter
MTQPSPPIRLPQPLSPLTLKTKLSYGVGEISKEVPSSILVFFVLFFLTNVAGLNAALAGGVLLVGRLWDALNDPLVGWMSDRTQSRWGRRYPWMLWGAVPLGLCFFLQWWVPPTTQLWVLFGYYSLIVILLYAALTVVAIPHSTLAAELTQGYDERTDLMSFKAFFSIGSSILGLVSAQVIFALVADTQHRYLVMGAVCGVMAVLSVFICVWGTQNRYWQMQAVRTPAQSVPSLPLGQQLRVIFRLRPFLYLLGIYLCSWVGLQVTAAILPYFVVYWMKLGEQHFTQMAIAVQGSALSTIVVWRMLGRRIGKRVIYCLGIPFTIIALFSLFSLQPGQVGRMYGSAVLAGIGLSTAYLVPWSMLPDVIDLDELNTGQRREGIFCGFLVHFQKMGTAFSIFLVGNLLQGAGLVTAVAGQARPVQPDSALQMIRWLMGPLPSLSLAIGMALALFYPISRNVHQKILDSLSKRYS